MAQMAQMAQIAQMAHKPVQISLAKKLYTVISITEDLSCSPFVFTKNEFKVSSLFVNFLFGQNNVIE
jgi:hypothetical protein